MVKEFEQRQSEAGVQQRQNEMYIWYRERLAGGTMGQGILSSADGAESHKDVSKTSL